MANTTTKKTTTTATTKRQSPAKSTAAVKTAQVKEDVAPKADVKAVPEEAAVKAKPREIDPEEFITVYNGFQGRLSYKSPRTGEKFVWPEFGDEQEMQLRELRSAKNTSKKYFINNWFMFDDEWVLDYLGVSQYYKHAIKISEFDDIFYRTADEIRETLSGLSAGQKRSVAYRAKQLIADEVIDSRKTIAMLEEVLGIELIEK